MIQIEVPDWVARKVLAGYLRDWDDCSESNQRDLAKIMAESLTAALGAWVETAGYVHPDTIKGLRAGLSSKSFLFAKPLPQMWADIPLYVLRQEKPE